MFVRHRPVVKKIKNNNQGFWYFARSQSREFPVNPRNPAKFTKTGEIPQNSPEIWPNTCRHSIFESYLGCMGLLTCCKLADLPWNFVTTSQNYQINVAKTGKQQCKNPCIPSVDRGNWGWEYDSLFYRVLALREECCVLWSITPYMFISSHLQRWRSFSDRLDPRMIMPENLQIEQSSCSFSRGNK